MLKRWQCILYTNFVVFAQWQPFYVAQSMFDCANLYVQKYTWRDIRLILYQLGNFRVYVNTRAQKKKDTLYSAVNKSAISYHYIQTCVYMLLHHTEYIEVTIIFILFIFFYVIYTYLYLDARILIIKYHHFRALYLCISIL